MGAAGTSQTPLRSAHFTGGSVPLELMAKKRHINHGGARHNAGRPQKENKGKWGKITCVLRLDTIAQLKAGVGSKADNPQFGTFLQRHLDRFPLPSFEQDQALQKKRTIIQTVRKRRAPILVSAGPGPAKRRRLLSQAAIDLRRTLAEVRKELEATA